jgi:hypothetical protein
MELSQRRKPKPYSIFMARAVADGTCKTSLHSYHERSSQLQSYLIVVAAIREPPAKSTVTPSPTHKPNLLTSYVEKQVFLTICFIFRAVECD